ncbi:MAG: hypothetical protein KJZ59_02030 [Pararhodobacter sp.]|nr:hypothetical protein [Pararhodobacter sp.]
MRAALAILTLAGLAACAPAGQVQRLDAAAGATAPIAAYRPGTPHPLPAGRPNSEMVRDFLELGFAMESGRPIEHFSRFEGPVRRRGWSIWTG